MDDELPPLSRGVVLDNEEFCGADGGRSISVATMQNTNTNLYNGATLFVGSLVNLDMAGRPRGLRSIFGSVASSTGTSSNMLSKTPGLIEQR